MPHRLLIRDPTLFVLAFGVWSLLSAVSLLWPGNAFTAVSSYRALLRLPLTENAWGAAMLLDAVLLWATAFRGRLLARATVALLSAALWLFFGTMVALGGYEAGTFSAIGTWEVAGGLGLSAAAVQWIAHAAPAEGPERPSPPRDGSGTWT